MPGLFASTGSWRHRWSDMTGNQGPLRGTCVCRVIARFEIFITSCGMPTRRQHSERNCAFTPCAHSQPLYLLLHPEETKEIKYVFSPAPQGAPQDTRTNIPGGRPIVSNDLVVHSNRFASFFLSWRRITASSLSRRVLGSDLNRFQHGLL